MQSVGAFPDGEWDFTGVFSAEELDFTPDFLGQCSFPLEHDEGSHFTTPSAFCPNPEANASIAGVNESLFYSWNTLNTTNLHLISQENSNNSTNCSSSVFIPSSSPENYYFGDSHLILATHDNPMSMDICIMDENNTGSFVPLFPEIAMVKNACINENMSRCKIGDLDDSFQPAANAVPVKGLQLKRKFDAPESNVDLSDNMKKKPRVTRDVQKRKKNAGSKKNKKVSPNSNDEEESNAGPGGQSSSSYSSEDDNASQDSNGGATSDSKISDAPNSNGKTRATRGSATDPQSLYARRRRERINERLRILQNLVPNGTKVDISTMLEEAAHYVKFLKLQIKLLSSDELWMYAPIAYNGIDVGLNQKISMLL